MPTFTSTLRYLYGLQERGMKLGLDNIRGLLSVFGNPQDKFPCVHIAGTNGKGSTAALLAAMLTASGYRTGLYNSPHLVKFSERIRIDGKDIPEEWIVAATRALRDEIERRGATFFEATTAIAFHYFAEKRVDVAVIETGLGGRLDATNLVNPLLTIITTIGLDHTPILGRSVTQIAREKGGIIKKGVLCIAGEMPDEALKTLKQIAARRKTRIIHCDPAASVRVRDYSLRGMVFDVRSGSIRYENCRSPLTGIFQKNNFLLALTAANAMREMGFERLNDRTMKRGLARVAEYSGIRGRLQVVDTSPLTIIDVAHNPDAMRYLVRSLRLFNLHKMVVIFGVMKDKDVEGMIAELEGVARVVVAVSADSPRAMEPGAIVRLFHSRGGKSLLGGGMHSAVRQAAQELRSDDALLVTGSHYVVGAFLSEGREGRGIFSHPRGPGHNP